MKTWVKMVFSTSFRPVDSIDVIIIYNKQKWRLKTGCHDECEALWSTGIMRWMQWLHDGRSGLRLNDVPS